jgi:hypothetical protein
MTDHLPVDQQVILGKWSVQQVAEDLAISYDDARDLMENAYNQGRVQMLGTDMFAGIQVDGKWVFVAGRVQLQQAAVEWATLRAMERQFEDG